MGSSIFRHTARAFLARGEIESALEEARHAGRTSYRVAAELFALPEIAALPGREDAADLRAFAAYVETRPRGNPPLPGELAVHWLDAVATRHKGPTLQHILRQFQIPGATMLRSVDAGSATFCETAYARFLNACLSDPDTRRFPAWDARRNYVVWGDLPGLGPAVHLIAASALYAERFFWADLKAKGPRPKFEIAETALCRAISRIA